MKKHLFLLMFLTCSVGKLMAQNYTISRLPIAEIAGTGTAVTMTNTASSAALPIGFNFDFWGTTYTDFFINPKGAIQFGSGSATGFSPYGSSGNFIPSANTPNNFVAFAWINGSSDFSNSDVSYFTSGSSPNQILVVNYKNVFQFGYGNVGSTTNVQIQFYETSNKIEIHNTTNTAPSGFVPFSGNIFIEKTIGIENSNGTSGRVALTSTTQWNLNNVMIRMEYCSFIPTIPTNVTPSTNFCSIATPTTLNATCASGTATWYTFTNQNYIPLANVNVTPTASTTYSVRCESGGSPNCTSNYVNINIGVIAPPTAPTLTRNPAGDVSAGNLVILTATGCTSATLLWSDGSTQTTNFSAVTKNVYPTTNTAYSAVCRDYNNCTSPTSNVLNVNVLTAPAVTSSTQFVCTGGSATLTASGCLTPDIVKWYINGNATSLGSGTSIVVSPTTIGGNYYFATCTRAALVSNNSASVLVELRASPTAPTSITKNPSGTVNPNTNVLLTANGCASGNTVKWENNSTSNPRTVNSALTTIYSAKCVSNMCESIATNVTVDVIGSIAVNPLSQTSYCPNTGTTIPVTFTATNTTGPFTISLFYKINSICAGNLPPFLITSISTNTNSGTLTIPSNLTPSGNDPNCQFGGSISYIISVSNGSLTSATVPVTITSSQTITNLLAMPATISTIGTSSVLSATCTGGTITWYEGLTELGTGTSITVIPTKTTTYSLICVSNSTNCSTSGTIKVPLIMNVSGTGITNLTGNFEEIPCSTCNASNPYTYTKNFFSFSCGQYGMFTCTTENKIIRVNDLWEINLTNNGNFNNTVSRLYYTKFLYNSQRPPCTTTWIKTSDGSEVTLTLSGVCENVQPLPCLSNLLLESTTDDISSGTSTKRANQTNGTITATNKITNTAKVTYQAKNIQLNAGFKADNGTVFKAEVGGCQ